MDINLGEDRIEGSLGDGKTKGPSAGIQFAPRKTMGTQTFPKAVRFFACRVTRSVLENWPTGLNYFLGALSSRDRR